MHLSANDRSMPRSRHRRFPEARAAKRKDGATLFDHTVLLFADVFGIRRGRGSFLRVYFAGARRTGFQVAGSAARQSEKVSGAETSFPSVL